MSKAKIYETTGRRQGDFWVVTMPVISKCPAHTQGRNQTEAHSLAIDLISRATGKPHREIALQVTWS